jgi:hypothetical protein
MLNLKQHQGHDHLPPHQTIPGMGDDELFFFLGFPSVCCDGGRRACFVFPPRVIYWMETTQQHNSYSQHQTSMDVMTMVDVRSDDGCRRACFIFHRSDPRGQATEGCDCGTVAHRQPHIWEATKRDGRRRRARRRHPCIQATPFAPLPLLAPRFLSTVYKIFRV